MKVSISEGKDLQFDFILSDVNIPLTAKIEDIFEKVKLVPEGYSGCFVEGIKQWMDNEDIILYYVFSSTNEYLTHFVWEKPDGTFWQLLPKDGVRIKFLETFVHKKYDISPYEPNENEKLMILLDRKDRSK